MKTVQIFERVMCTSCFCSHPLLTDFKCNADADAMMITHHDAVCCWISKTLWRCPPPIVRHDIVLLCRSCFVWVYPKSCRVGPSCKHKWNQVMSHVEIFASAWTMRKERCSFIILCGFCQSARSHLYLLIQIQDHVVQGSMYWCICTLPSE